MYVQSAKAILEVSQTPSRLTKPVLPGTEGTGTWVRLFFFSEPETSALPTQHLNHGLLTA